MQLELWLDGASLRRWHRRLVDSLRDRGDVSVAVRLIPGRHDAGTRADQFVFRLESALHRIRPDGSSPLHRSAFEDFLAPSEASPDIVVDLTGTDPPARGAVWRLTFDGAAGERAALAALRSRRAPVVRIEDLRSGEQVAGGRPGSETPGVLVAAFEDLLTGCGTLLHAALDRAAARAPAPSPDVAVASRGVVGRGLSTVASTGMQYGYRGAFRAPHWRVGWRFVDGPDVVDLLDHPASGWHDLPDDGYHFYADPFPVVAGADTYLFVEDFDHRIGRGGISVVPFGADGPVGTPYPVLRRDIHLSYPFVLEADGETWMIPETSGASTVELYRATAFPDRWVREAVLLHDVVASDATVFRHEGRWWMTATVRSGGSYSDTLHVWFADSVTGPWKSHPANPVLVDIAAARPAGRVVSRDGRLFRPVQDNRAGYGAALGIAEITRLDETGFEQQILGVVGPGARWPGRRVHTLNRAGDLECIDGSRWSPRFRTPRRRERQ